MQYMKKGKITIASVVFAAFSMAAVPADPSLSFNANFDAYSVKANFARGEILERKVADCNVAGTV